MVTNEDLTVERLDAIYPRRQLSDEKATVLRDMAVNYVNDVFGGNVSRVAEIEGNEVDFAMWVWAAFVEERDGETQSESQTGGSVSYGRDLQNDPVSLPNNRFGRVAQGYLRNEISIGVVKGQSSYD